MASTYTIKQGDTLDAVAKQLGVDSTQLASANNLKSGAELTAGNVLNVPTATSSTGASTGTTTATQNTASPYTGLSGLSTTTKDKLGQYGQGYTASDSVNAAQQYLQNVVNGKPGDYKSQYQGQLESLYNQVMNREPFTFDLNGDALYSQYKDKYTQLGQQAMMDTMGQAAAMTGGYGNSYAQTAGQQAYQNYLTQLNDIVPDLYQEAYDRYKTAGEELRDNLNLTQSLENDAYGKYRDTVSDWNNEREYASGEYWNQYNADYNSYSDMLNYWNTLAQQENSQYNTDLELAYSQAMAAIQIGVVPSSALLKKAGISSADAKAMAKAYKKKSSSGGGGGGSSYSGYSSGGRSTSGSGTTASVSAAASGTDKQNKYYSSLSSYLTSGAGSKASATTKTNRIDAALKSGNITSSQASELKKKVNG